MEYLDISIEGQSHRETGLGNQDFYLIERLGEGWDIILVSDGAGSAQYSKIGAELICKCTLKEVKNWIKSRGWKKRNRIPKAATWTKNIKDIFLNVRKQLLQYAQKKSHDAGDYHATVILCIVTPVGLLTANIGDGRAAFTSNGKDWFPCIQPVNGIEEGSTVFLSWKHFQSGKKFIYSGRYPDKINSIAVMTDGCERAAFTVMKEDENGHLERCNIPNNTFLSQNRQAIIGRLESGSSIEEIKTDFTTYIEGGTAPLKNSRDDKTIIIGFTK